MSRNVPESLKDIHTRHCCATHGCKYGEDETCTVVQNPILQEFSCEDGDFQDEPCFKSFHPGQKVRYIPDGRTYDFGYYTDYASHKCVIYEAGERNMQDSCAVDSSKLEAVSTAEGQSPLPNGCTLYWKTNEAGGRTYYTDECAIMAVVWDTCIVAQSTLVAAMTKEAELQHREYHARRQNG